MINPRKSADSNDNMSMIINNAFGVVDVVDEGEDDDDEVTTTSNNNAIQAQSTVASINENERHNSVYYPRIIELKVDDNLLAAISHSSLLRGVTSNNNNDQRKIEVSRTALKEQERLLDSEDFSYRDPLYEDDCVPMQKWQETSFPICNLFHELDFAGKSMTGEFEYLTHGGYNDIFWIEDMDQKDDPELVMKILQYGTDYSDRNFDRVRRDGLILERLTKSPYVLDTYGFCGFDVLTPYANGKSLTDHLYSWHRGKLKLSNRKRLQYAVEVAEGLAAVHDIDGEGLSSVSHGDLKGQQYLFLNGEMKLGDFNRGRFLRRNSTAPDTACTYTIGKNDAKFRSPEEYEYLPQTSAIDIYAVGSILFELLTGDDVWSQTPMKEAQKRIRKGELPPISEEIAKSTDPVDVALREAIFDLCYIFDPKERAKAGDVAAFLQKKMSELPADYK